MNLSGGQRQMVTREGVAKRPRLLLLDEPSLRPRACDRRRDLQLSRQDARDRAHVLVDRRRTRPRFADQLCLMKTGRSIMTDCR